MKNKPEGIMDITKTAELVRRLMQITYQSSTWEDGYTHVRVEATILGQMYWAVGNSKYRMNDAKEGLRWNSTVGINKAVGRAISKIAHHVVAAELKRKEEEDEMLRALVRDATDPVMAMP